MQNFFLVKTNSTELYETGKYTTALHSYVDNFDKSQAFLAKLNLG